MNHNYPPNIWCAVAKPDLEVYVPYYRYRVLEPPPSTRDQFDGWIATLDDEFGRNLTYDKRSSIVARELREIFGFSTPESNSECSITQSVVYNSLDPRNVTLEPEYYGDVDVARFNERKPLIYFWQMFDRSSLGSNQWLGCRLRAMLGRHIFKALGSNVKIFQNVEFSFGYNLVIEDDCVIHRNVLLDDRGGLIIRRGTSISDYANIYSHSHDIYEQADITNQVTEIGPAARITYHATVLAGVHIGENALLGALGVATRHVAPHTVSLGIPAKHIKIKNRSGTLRDQSG